MFELSLAIASTAMKYLEIYKFAINFRIFKNTKFSTQIFIIDEVESFCDEVYFYKK